MNNPVKSLLLLGESDVGKTHYGAQLLRRLNLNVGALKMSGAPSSIEPFVAALEKLSLGLAAIHTPGSLKQPLMIGSLLSSLGTPPP